MNGVRESSTGKGRTPTQPLSGNGSRPTIRAQHRRMGSDSRALLHIPICPVPVLVRHPLALILLLCGQDDHHNSRANPEKQLLPRQHYRYRELRRPSHLLHMPCRPEARPARARPSTMKRARSARSRTTMRARRLRECCWQTRAHARRPGWSKRKRKKGRQCSHLGPSCNTMLAAWRRRAH